MVREFLYEQNIASKDGEHPVLGAGGRKALDGASDDAFGNFLKALKAKRENAAKYHDDILEKAMKLHGRIRDGLREADLGAQALAKLVARRIVVGLRI